MDSRFFDQNAISLRLLLLYSGRWLCGDVFCGHIQPTVGHHGKGGVPAIGKKTRELNIFDSLVHVNWSLEDKRDFYNIAVGTLQYGQSKDFVFPMRLKPEAGLCASLRYHDGNHKQVAARLRLSRCRSHCVHQISVWSSSGAGAHLWRHSCRHRSSRGKVGQKTV